MYNKHEMENARAFVASKCNIKLSLLTHYLYHVDDAEKYKTILLPKKDGSTREINAPVGFYKVIIKNLYKYLYCYYQDYQDKQKRRNDIVHGFVKNKSIFTNANVHRNKRVIISFDIEKFFPSITSKRVFGLLNNSHMFSFSKEISNVITNLVCYQGHLAQGAATSPLLANALFSIVDRRIIDELKGLKIKYTRYADDIFVSSACDLSVAEIDKIINIVSKIIKKFGFSINGNKTHVVFNNNSQQVTGLVVNKKINIPNKYYRNTSSMCMKYISDGEFYNENHSGLKYNNLLGRLNYIVDVKAYEKKRINIKPVKKPKDNALFSDYFEGIDKWVHKVLFFHEYINSEYVSIVTEGVTDPMHIKAAMEALCVDDVHLVIRNKLISRYLFDGNSGGDSELLVVRQYNSKSIDWFIKKQFDFKNPVILLYDNEFFCSTDSPVKKSFKTDYIKDKDKKKEELKQNYWVHLKYNLYAMVIPNNQSGKDYEIEDLYDEDTLKITKYGKSFNRNPDANKDQFYSKAVFASIIRKNKDTSIFNGFKPLFNVIDSIKADYYLHKTDYFKKD